MAAKLRTFPQASVSPGYRLLMHLFQILLPLHQAHIQITLQGRDFGKESLRPKLQYRANFNCLSVFGGLGCRLLFFDQALLEVKGHSYPYQCG